MFFIAGPHLGEGSEGESALDFAHVVLQNVFGGIRLSQVEAIVDFQTLAHGLLEGKKFLVKILFPKRFWEV